MKSTSGIGLRIVPTKVVDWYIFLFIALAALIALLLQPRLNISDRRPEVILAELIPTNIHGWTLLPDATAQVIDPQQQQTIERTYSQTLSRTYVNQQGYRIMLSVVYGKTQRGNLQLHHPEICYPAQGFEVLTNTTSVFSTPMGTIPVRQLQTRLSASRVEPVSYWAMVGDEVVLGSAQRKLVEIRHGLSGFTTDGLLFRISSIDSNTPRAFERQQNFVQQMLYAMPKDARRQLAGV
ncbi:EpsI family protein [Curvibacter sp. APW13]|uniref:exosortase-associated protein EpsI, B-type n=1 Tax=Curvibacter sp. APW13 TaxID=3077236 RepID=UPI0028E01E12|nr:exosortase-associated protein EpsI, B-type [Curvibacter sp. APW13]MDT8992591.1 EpsI family protein [Curvibacter sp. APW13]